MTAFEILKKYWNYNEFRPMQQDVINSVIDKKDTLAIMPTGGGKSLCFQVPALMADGMCLVITPLIALMKDQVANLKTKGILSLAIHSGLKFHDVKKQLENAIHGDFRFLYVSPERLETSLFLEYLPFLNINLIAVDEAHCISQWGYDFRPAYLRIAILRQYLPEVPVLALTASATPEVQADICEKLEFRRDFRLYSQSYERKNLSYSVFIPPARENKVIEILHKVPGSAIGYCRSRKRTRELAELMRLHHILSDFYHAGLPMDERNQKQEDWIRNKTRVICCTNAFGMGIDKPDVRTVIHYDMPDALENYYQEAGRAGRDGVKSYAVLLFHPADINESRARIPLKFPEVEDIRTVYSAICSFIQLPAGKGEGLSFNFEIAQFIEIYKLNPILVTSALKILEQEEIFFLSDNLFTPSSAEFLASKKTLEDFERNFPKYASVVKGLLRSYEGILEQPCFIDEFTLARFIGKQKSDVIQQLNDLNKMQIIDYAPRGDVPKIYFIRNRVPAADLIINEANITKRKAAYEKRLSAMIDYATQTDECRSVFINRYFGGKPILPCGICDICLGKKRQPLSAVELGKITQVLRENKQSFIKDIEIQTKLHRDKVSNAINFLKRENEIAVNKDGSVTYKGR